IILISPHQRFWQRFRPHRLDCQRAHDGGNDRGRTARTKDAAHRGQRSDDARPTVRTQYADRYAHRYDPNVDKSAEMPPRKPLQVPPPAANCFTGWLGKAISSLILRLQAVRIPPMRRGLWDLTSGAEAGFSAAAS